MELCIEDSSYILLSNMMELCTEDSSYILLSNIYVAHCSQLTDWLILQSMTKSIPCKLQDLATCPKHCSIQL
jgi:hypothetical protein